MPHVWRSTFRVIFHSDSCCVSLKKHFLLLFSFFYIYIYYQSFACCFALSNGFTQQYFSCDQAALRTLLSVCPSVCLSACLSVTPFSLCSGYSTIMKFSGVINIDKSNGHVRCQGHRSKVKVTEVITQLNRLWTITPVWIHIWWWNDAYSLM